MKTILNLFIVSILASSFAFSQNVSVTVVIEDLRTDEGTLLIQILNEKEEPVQKKSVEIKEGRISVIFDEVPAGKYAVSYIHDENNNNELDTGMMGIPKEGYGFSNDARGFMGPPSFEDQMFELVTDTRMTLKTKYW